MLSIRSIARSAPRVVSRLTSTALQRPALRQASLLQSWKASSAQYTAYFSTSPARRREESDEELIQKLDAEIGMESDMKDNEGVPTSVKDYLENGPFEIIDVPGEEDVILTRTYGDETIRITFSIADLNNLDPEEQYEQDRAMADEQENGEKSEEDQIEDDGEGNPEGEGSYPARVNVIVEKAGKGALAVETVAQDGMIVIENVYYYKDAAHAHAKTIEKVHERQDLYVGPPFSNLDEDLQVLLERYLEERGVNAALAIFVPDYIDMKEQKEYLRWLSNVKGFVEA